MTDNETSIKKPPFYIRWFFPILVLLGLAGGAAALWVPSNTSWLRQSGFSSEAEQKSISDLRLHFLYITGGIIAILTLLQTNWKNQVDQRKVEDDIQKNKNDHIRQVHAERRSRYTKAVEQIANEKASVRLGGVYTLFELIDEWLADENLDKSEAQQKGQTIVTILCSYIRLPFPLAINTNILQADTAPDSYVGDFVADQVILREEQDVRRTIFVEMSKRSTIFGKDKNGEVVVNPRMWSDFDFDFSRAPIFYPLNNLVIEKANFSSARFYGDTSFFNTVFNQNVDFSETVFTHNTNFKRAKITHNANFKRARFTQSADFSLTIFTQAADFESVEFFQTADFRSAKFLQYAGFSTAKFAQNADFESAEFFQTADFRSAKFLQTVKFSQIKFSEAIFSEAKFNQDVDFSRTAFAQDADFSGATFTQNVDFRGATFKRNAPKFVRTFTIANTTNIFRARFAVLSEDQGIRNVTVSEISPSIPLGKAELNDVRCCIPVGTVLFDPASWDERQKEYTRLSKPAQ